MGNVVAHEVAARAADHIRDTAKAKLGHYQQASGPFGEWAPLAERTMKERVELGYTPDDPLLRSGALRDSIGVTLTGTSAVVGSTADYAPDQELGAGRIPPRPFLAPAAFEAKREIYKLAEEVVIKWAAGRPFIRHEAPF